MVWNINGIIKVEMMDYSADIHPHVGCANALFALWDLPDLIVSRTRNIFNILRKSTASAKDSWPGRAGPKAKAWRVSLGTCASTRPPRHNDTHLLSCTHANVTSPRMAAVRGDATTHKLTQSGYHGAAAGINTAWRVMANSVVFDRDADANLCS